MSSTPHSNASMSLRVDHRELATILAALRFHQDENLQGGGPIPDKAVEDIATDGGTLKPLDSQEIERLCQRLNLDSEPAGLNVEPPHRDSGPEPLFRVVYVIDVNAPNAQEAARQVHQIMADPQSQPPMLQVMDASGKVRDVDLSQP
jgi:EAL domain-containing protein (putative c-di-GMP-specific phosphodiesterase class I)